MCAQPNQGLLSRKRRRQAVVCTECRRRKIACDRNSPCAQCIQSNSSCTYYDSYNSSYSANDFSRDHENGTKHYQKKTSSSPAQAGYGFGPAPTYPFSNTTDIGMMPSAYIDPGASSWFDIASLSSLPLPLSIETTHLPFSDSSGNRFLSLEEGEKGEGITNPSPDTLSPINLSYQASAGIVFQKSRFYGRSHWVTLFCKYEQQGLFDDINSTLFQGEGHPILQKCKILARRLKSVSGPDPQLLLRPLHEFMPPKEVAGQLVQLYLQTFESVLRILHVPTLMQEYVQYWRNPQGTNETLVLQLLLIMAIGTCFYQKGPLSSNGIDTLRKLHKQSAQWIYIAQMRLAAPVRKDHLDLRGVQTQCLLVLALLTNVNALGGNLTWVATASVVQSGMAIGLHFAPSQLPVSSFEAEIRRRLWATIIELAVQASLDSGMPPIISSDVLDSCEPPSNLDDSQFNDSTKSLPASQPRSVFTQSSIQCALFKSLPIRLKITETLSRFRSELSYQLARSMGAELTAALRETSELMDSYRSKSPSAFQIQLQDCLARRFLLILHAQFAHKAANDFNYHFSRTVCLECSLLLLSPSQNKMPDETPGDGHGEDNDNLVDDHMNLRVHGDGLFKNVFLAAAFTLCAELLLQLREDSSPSGSSLSRRELHNAIREAISFTRLRLEAGETSVKANAFLSCVLAKTNSISRPSSLQHKLPTRKIVADAAKRALDSCCEILEARIGHTTPSGHSGSSIIDEFREDPSADIVKDSGREVVAMDDSSDTWPVINWENDTVL